MTAIPYHLMTRKELEREARDTDNKLALAILATQQQAVDEAYTRGEENGWTEGYAAGVGE